MSENQPKGLTSSGLLRGFGVVLLLAALLFAMEGLYRLHRENVESTEWPAVQASFLNCYIRQHSSLSRSRNVSYQTVCKFRYTVNNEILESSTRTTSAQSQSVVDRMGVWIKQHPKGTVQTIHYNPTQPGEISLAGADNEIQTHSASVKLHAAVVLAVAGLFFLILSFILHKYSRPANSALLANSGTQ